MKYLQPQLFTAKGISVTNFVPPSTGIWAAGSRDSAIAALLALGPVQLRHELNPLADRTTSLQPPACRALTA